MKKWFNVIVLFVLSLIVVSCSVCDCEDKECTPGVDVLFVVEGSEFATGTDTVMAYWIKSDSTRTPAFSVKKVDAGASTYGAAYQFVFPYPFTKEVTLDSARLLFTNSQDSVLMDSTVMIQVETIVCNRCSGSAGSCVDSYFEQAEVNLLLESDD